MKIGKDSEDRKMKTFIYQPKSGDRVFALKANTSMVVIEWDNGCRHLVGDYVVLTYDVAQSGSWWRRDAKTVAANIVALWGGVAWDECGTVHLAVPAREAFRAHTMMTVAQMDHRGHHGEVSYLLADHNGLRLIAAKVAVLQEQNYQLVAHPLGRQSEIVGEVNSAKNEYGTTVSSIVGTELVEVTVSKEDWAVRSIIRMSIPTMQE